MTNETLVAVKDLTGRTRTNLIALRSMLGLTYESNKELIEIDKVCDEEDDKFIKFTEDISNAGGLVHDALDVVNELLKNPILKD